MWPVRRGVEASRAEVKQAHERFQQRFAYAGFVVDKAARQALTQKSEAETVLAELESAIAIQDRQRQEALLPASQEGRSLASAHASAWAAWSHLAMMRALDDHGLHFARAVARTRSGTPDFAENRPFKPEATPREQALKFLAGKLSDWAGSLYAHGADEQCAQDDPVTPVPADLGPLRMNDLMDWAGWKSSQATKRAGWASWPDNPWHHSSVSGRRSCTPSPESWRAVPAVSGRLETLGRWQRRFCLTESRFWAAQPSHSLLSQEIEMGYALGKISARSQAALEKVWGASSLDAVGSLMREMADRGFQGPLSLAEPDFMAFAHDPCDSIRVIASVSRFGTLQSGSGKFELGVVVWSSSLFKNALPSDPWSPTERGREPWHEGYVSCLVAELSHLKWASLPGAVSNPFWLMTQEGVSQAMRDFDRFLVSHIRSLKSDGDLVSLLECVGEYRRQAWVKSDPPGWRHLPLMLQSLKRSLEAADRNSLR